MLASVNSGLNHDTCILFSGFFFFIF